MKKSKTDKFKADPAPQLNSASAGAEKPEGLINRFGTYNIQPTAGTENEFPEIAQGLPEVKKEKGD